MAETNKLMVLLLIFSVISVFVIELAKTIFKLLRNRTAGKLIMKNNKIYKIIPNKCLICGDLCGGKLIIKGLDGDTVCECHRDKNHRWKIEYNDVMMKIDDCY